MNLMATTRQGRTLAVAGVIVLLGLADGCIGPSPSTNEATRPGATTITAPTPIEETISSYEGWVAFASRRSGDFDLYLAEPDGSQVLQMGLASLGPSLPAWSPDWTKVAFTGGTLEGYDIYVVDVTCLQEPEGCATQARNLTADDNCICSAPSWSPDGRLIAFSRAFPSKEAEIWTMSDDGTNKHSLNGLIGTSPDWSPDSLQIAYTAAYCGLYPSSLVGLGVSVWVANVDGTSSSCLVSDPADSGQPAWSPAGDLIAFASAEGRDIRGGALTGIFVVQPDGSNPRRISGVDMGGLWPRWSPDGTVLVFEYSGPGGGLYTLKVDGSDLTKITDDETDTTPAWAP